MTEDRRKQVRNGLRTLLVDTRHAVDWLDEYPPEYVEIARDVLAGRVTPAEGRERLDAVLPE